jgi:hypothetical protein
MSGARLHPCHSSRHRSQIAIQKSTGAHQIKPGGSDDLLLHAMGASSHLILQLQPTLRLPAPRLSHLWTASPPAWASVRPRVGKSTLKRRAVRRVRDRREECLCKMYAMYQCCCLAFFGWVGFSAKFLLSSNHLTVTTHMHVTTSNC